MYGGVMGGLFVLAALVIWRLLGRTRLPLGWRILVAVLATVLVCAALFWGGICAGILFYQLRDPITW